MAGVNEPGTIQKLLGAKTIAVIGLSEDPAKPSHYVSAAMQRYGCRILPVNPGLDSVLGEQAHPSLRALPEQPDMVNVFRLPRFVPAIVDEMIELGLGWLWLQQGIVHAEAIRRAEDYGILVVADRCLMVEKGRMR